MINNLQLNSSFKYKTHRDKKNKPFKLLILIFLAGVIILSISKLFPKSSTEKVADNTPTLKKIVQNALKEIQGSYALTVKNLKTGEIYSIDEHKTFETGSFYKLWLMAAAYKQIQQGLLKEDELLSADIADLNKKFNIASDSAEQTEGTITLTVKDTLTQMITISHNYAALLLTEKVGYPALSTYLKENEFNESSVGNGNGPPKSTPADIAKFYEKLYKGKLTNQEYTEKMINLLKSQKLNDGLPKYLPDQSKIAHKTGEIGWLKHDAGIVYTKKGDYILAIMSETDFPEGAQERIALISKAVFDYFDNQVQEESIKR